MLAQGNLNLKKNKIRLKSTEKKQSNNYVIEPLPSLPLTDVQVGGRRVFIIEATGWFNRSLWLASYTRNG